MSDKDAVKLRYVGDGFAPGVPARDLTEAEVAEFGGLRALLATGLYEKVEDKAAAGKKAEKDGE